MSLYDIEPDDRVGLNVVFNGPEGAEEGEIIKATAQDVVIQRRHYGQVTLHISEVEVTDE